MNNFNQPSPESLFPNPDDRRRMLAHLDEQIAAARAAAVSGSVTPRDDLHGFRDHLGGFDFAQPTPLAVVTDWVLEQLASGIVQVTHPGYMGLFNPSPAFPSECADRIAAALNPQNCVWSHAPVAVEIEAHVIAQIARRIGYADGAGGHFTSGGAEANATGLLCALTNAHPGFAENGVGVFTGPPRFYASAESHLAWLKIAHQSGIGRSAVRLIETDGAGRLDPAALNRAIASDLAAGNVPFMIAATAGTTNAGMVDPLPQCAEIAKANGLWLHVDAAWGGALIASERERGALAGIEAADSVTIDAHKWFAATMGTGMFITRRRGTLSETFRVNASYMPSNDEAVDLYVNSFQWSRRFVGLRLFLSLAAAGWSGFADHVERAIDLADYLGEEMQKHGWVRLNQSRMAVVCLAPPAGGKNAQATVSAVLAKGEHWISSAVFEGRQVVRFCITNGTTTKFHVDQVIGSIVDG